MASVEELRREIAVANQDIDSARGAFQQGISSLEQAQGALAQAIQGSSQAEAGEINNMIAQAVELATNAARLTEQVQSTTNAFAERL
ncbi:MAG TPA: hypothetical protein VG317_07320 [Pseudonocardiaceae bacterium]|jgi:hypothetical protein|nr:hypothetical protein [Pseudonocardiaceae bacterium]